MAPDMEVPDGIRSMSGILERDPASCRDIPLLCVDWHRERRPSAACPARSAMTSDTPPPSPFFRPPEPPKPVASRVRRAPASPPPRQLDTGQFWALICGIVVVSVFAGLLWNEARTRNGIGAKAQAGAVAPRVSIGTIGTLKRPAFVFQSRRAYEAYWSVIGEAQDLTDREARAKQAIKGFVHYVECNIRPDHDEIKVMRHEGPLVWIKVIDGPNAACVGVVAPSTVTVLR